MRFRLRSRGLVLVSGVLGAVLVTATGCGSASPGSGPGGTTGPIVIGYIGAMTGPTAQDNIATVDLEKLVADQVNASGGVNGRKVKIVTADDQGKPSEARTLALKMVEQQHVDALAGPLYSTEAIAVTQISDTLGVPIVGLQASVDKVVYPKGTTAAPYKWVYSSAVSADSQMNVLMSYAKTKGWKNVALIYQDDSFGTAPLPQFVATAKKLGINLVLKQSIAPKVVDATPQVVAIGNAKPQAVISWTNPAATAPLLKALRAAGNSMPFLMNVSNISKTFGTLAGSVGNGTYAANYRAGYVTAGPVATFEQQFKSKYGFAIIPQLLPIRDGLEQYLAAVKAAGSTSPAAVVKQINAITYHGIVETVHYTPDLHEIFNPSAQVIVTVNNGVGTPVSGSSLAHR